MFFAVIYCQHFDQPISTENFQLNVNNLCIEQYIQGQIKGFLKGEEGV